MATQINKPPRLSLRRLEYMKDILIAQKGDPDKRHRMFDEALFAMFKYDEKTKNEYVNLAGRWIIRTKGLRKSNYRMSPYGKGPLTPQQQFDEDCKALRKNAYMKLMDAPTLTDRNEVVTASSRMNDADSALILASRRGGQPGRDSKNISFKDNNDSSDNNNNVNAQKENYNSNVFVNSISSSSSSSSSSASSSSSQAMISQVATISTKDAIDFVAGHHRSLRHILEDPSIIKLMFDVRADSAALSKQFNVQLKGLYDLQIMYAYRFQAQEDTYLKGLKKVFEVFSEQSANKSNSLIRKCGNSGVNVMKYIQVNNSMPDSSTRKDFHGKWDARPLPIKNLVYAACDVVHMADLYHEWATEKGDQISDVLESELERTIPELSAKRAEKATSNVGFGSFGQGVGSGAHRDFELPTGRKSCRPGTGIVATGRKGFGKGRGGELDRMLGRILGGGFDSDDELGGFGFTMGEEEELWAQGVKPWDDDAGAVLDALNGGF